MANAWIIQPLPLTAVSASGTAAGDPLNVGNDYAGVIWRAPSGTVASLTLDFGADVAIDAFAAFGIKGAPAGSTMTVYAATSAQGAFGGSYWTGASQALYAGSIMPVSGRGVALWSAPGGTPPPSAFRYLRIGVTAGSAFVLEVARVVAGPRIQLTRNFGYNGTFGVRDLGSLDFSARGVLLRRRASKLRTVALTFSNIRKEEVEASTKPLLEQIGNTEMIALVTDPSSDAQLQNRCYFGPLVGDLSHVWRNAAAWEAKVNVVSIF